jgi:pimeloyl-ACP methyl ester carboxylesterase
VTTRAVPVGGDRVMTVDDVGDPEGAPVLYLHGTPDSRLARHPDDGLAARAGVRLLAVDRPGYGGSDPLPQCEPGDWPAALGAAVVALLDALAVDRCAVLAWSGGALPALALAARLPARVAALGVAAGLVPRQAYDEPDVRAVGESRLGAIGLADVLPPGELGEALAPLLAPYPCDRAVAAEHQSSQRDAAGAAELASVPGGVDRMAEALVEAVRRGLAGAAADVEAQARPLLVDLAAITCPVWLWYGSADTVTPPAFGHWYARRLPCAELTVVEGAAHFLAFARWSEMLGALSAAV